jgi:hypothetical protein
VSVFDALDPEMIPSVPDPNQPVGDPITGPASAPAEPAASVAPDPNQPSSRGPWVPSPVEPEAPTAEPTSGSAAPAGPVAFHSGQVVKTPLGFAVVVKTGPAPRLGDGGIVDQPGYVIARLGDSNETPHTAEELGLEAI